MNKDVIYIEPEQDITDILANIKSAKNKIIALVPPKKAGVLRSAVNFKLIAKTARQNEKTVVLITTDDSLRRLASSVAMPTAKSLQSKPQLPDDDDAVEFGEGEAGDEIEDDGDEFEDEADEEAEEAVAPAPKAKKVPVATAVKVTKKKPAEDDVIEGEPEAAEESEEKPKTKNSKNVAKMKGAKIPNFAKYRKFIIAGSIGLVLLIGFIVWATVFAPAATISVKVRAKKETFEEKVSFVKEDAKSDNAKGIFLIEEKTVTKKSEGEFKATGKVDKGAKASGTITVNRAKGDTVDCNETDSILSIPKDTVVTISGKEFIVTEGGSANALDKNGDITSTGRGDKQVCTLAKDISSGAIKVVAKEVGDGYNVAASKEIKININTKKKYTSSSSAMTGGSSKVVTVVSKEDVETASSNLNDGGEAEAQQELNDQISGDYILVGSMKRSDPKITTSPNLNEEVGDNVTPKIVREVVYTQLAVSRESVKRYIEEVAKSRITGDDTQIIYSTGIEKAFFDKFQDSNNEMTAKLKTEYKTGPRVTEEMVAEKSLGKKTGEVQKQLKSINGITDVKIKTSFFWVSTIPNDTNKVEITIETEE